MLIDVTLYLFYGNRKITVLLDNSIDEALISQRFVIENKLQITPVRRMRIAVNGHQITIYGAHDLEIKIKDNYNIIRSTRRMFYVINMTYYNIILGLAWLDYVNPDIYWLEREWFYRDSITSVKEFSKKDFEKSLKKKIIIYVFYKVSIELE
jgi:hypothetical protein